MHVRGLVGACAFLVTVSSVAAETRAQSGGSQIMPNGLYLRADGDYQSINLPAYTLGFSNGNGPTDTYGGQAVVVNPTPTGGGFRGAVGYMFPGAGPLSGFGTNQRVELGGSYAGASSTQSGSASPAAGSALQQQFLNGTLVVSAGCAGGTPCTLTQSLHTDFTAWSLDAKAATDFRFGALTVSPSLAVFGGNSEADQNLNQFFNNHGGGGTVNYLANTKLDWDDWGGRAGVRVSGNVSESLSAAISGSIAGASRHANLRGSDLLLAGAAFPGSFAGASKDTGALIGNIEISFMTRVVPSIPGFTLRGFGGVTFDNNVPQIKAPSYSGPFSFSAPSTPANIGFRAEMSYYIGAGATMHY